MSLYHHRNKEKDKMRTVSFLHITCFQQSSYNYHWNLNERIAFWNVKLTYLLSHSKCGLHRGHSLKGKQSCCEFPKHDPKAININFLCVRFLLNHLRCHPTISSLVSLGFLALCFKTRCTKICYFNPHIIIKKQIVGFEVSVDYPLWVKVFHSSGYVKS